MLRDDNKVFLTLRNFFNTLQKELDLKVCQAAQVEIKGVSHKHDNYETLWLSG